MCWVIVVLKVLNLLYWNRVMVSGLVRIFSVIVFGSVSRK